MGNGWCEAVGKGMTNEPTAIVGSQRRVHRDFFLEPATYWPPLHCAIVQVVLLQSPKMVTFYQQACSHAVRLQVFFNNKSNLRSHWSDMMLKELEWFRDHTGGHDDSDEEGLPSQRSGLLPRQFRCHSFFRCCCGTCKAGVQCILGANTYRVSAKNGPGVVQFLGAFCGDKLCDTNTKSMRNFFT